MTCCVSGGTLNRTHCGDGTVLACAVGCDAVVCQWMKWHGTSNVLLAGTKSGDTWMWLVTTSSCKTFAGFGQRCTAGEILHDGKRHHFILAAAERLMSSFELLTS